jgi:hypothetical protein
MPIIDESLVELWLDGQEPTIPTCQQVAYRWWYEVLHGSSTALSAVARHLGLLPTPGPSFYLRRGRHRRLRLPYSADEQMLTEAVARLVLATSTRRHVSVNLANREVDVSRPVTGLSGTQRE